jgi:hypothetical protein
MKEEQTGRSSPSFSPQPSDYQQSAYMPGQGVEPDLEFVSGKPTTAITEGLTANLNGPMRSQKWHGPYAEALLETDPVKAGAAISNAKRAILGRYLELCTMENRVDEVRDLENAMNALSDLGSGKTDGLSDKGPDDRDGDNTGVTLRTENLACAENKNTPA